MSDAVDGNIKGRDSLPVSGQQLFKASLQERQNTPKLQIQSLIGLMYQRCHTAVAARDVTQGTDGLQVD